MNKWITGRFAMLRLVPSSIMGERTNNSLLSIGKEVSVVTSLITIVISSMVSDSGRVFFGYHFQK